MTRQERRVERVLGFVSERPRDARQRVVTVDELLSRQHHPPAREVGDRRLLDPLAKACGEGRSRHADPRGQLLHGPGERRIRVHRAERRTQLGIGEGREPSGSSREGSDRYRRRACTSIMCASCCATSDEPGRPSRSSSIMSSMDDLSLARSPEVRTWMRGGNVRRSTSAWRLFTSKRLPTRNTSPPPL